jgi:hypothetical protein
VLLTQVNGHAMLLRNEIVPSQASARPADAADASAGGAQPAAKPHWLRVQLKGNGATANRDAIGAIVELTAGGVSQKRMVMPTRSYLSQVELPITFGLGESTQVESLRITWPDGSRSEHEVAAIDRMIVITQAR